MNEDSTFKMATTEGQHIEDLQGEENFRVSCRIGMGCFMDAETQDSLNHLENRLFLEKGKILWGFMKSFSISHFFDENGAIDQFAFLNQTKKTRKYFCFRNRIWRRFLCKLYWFWCRKSTS